MKFSNLLKPVYPLLVLTIFMAGACNQDAIFHEISQQNKPLEARIKGNPSNMVVSERGGTPLLYVASGSSLHWYGKPKAGGNPGWDKDEYKIPNPKGDIRGLAATTTYLYAATSSGLKRIAGTESDWTVITTDSFQTVFACEDKVFAGKGDDIWYLDEASTSHTLHQLRTDTGNLTGAAYNGTNYYVSTSKRIYKLPVSGFPNPVATESENHDFKGMIRLENADEEIVAIERSGQLYLISTAGGISNSQKMNQYATTALAVWRGSAGTLPQLLLAGRQESLATGYTYGYQELPLNNGKISGAFKEPGKGPPTSLNHGGNYTSSIGTHPVNHLFQAPPDVDPNMTLFASTQNAGLWSYRNHSSGGWHWNAEE
ncbi:MAG: hypothetical protein LBK62_02455 [Treponema sp.]|jgi:hypothetical protein|nr:hypothetical protein [Treponema sp.]